MNKLIIGSAMALALTSTQLPAVPVHAQADIVQFGATTGERVWLAQGNSNGNGKGNGGGNKKVVKKDKGNPGNGNGNGNAQSDNRDRGPDRGNRGNGGGKPDHAGGPDRDERGNGNRAARAFDASERESIVERVLSTRAPAGRDMTRILGASALTYLTPDLLVSDIRGDDLIGYRNCPPGLAKKDPPCVPPGLAKNGVSYDEWASYDRDEYDSIWLERRGDWLRTYRDVDPDPDLLLLRSDQVARLFDLDPAPDGQRYAVIDGMPVLLDDDDYTSLLLVNQMAQVSDLMAGAPIAPTAALSQDELINTYRLPRLRDDENYAVVNGQLVRLNDSNYETLQMIRIARAIF